eukprot:179485-Chlamydomonas_euryale.AAC.2
MPGTARRGLRPPAVHRSCLPAALPALPRPRLVRPVASAAAASPCAALSKGRGPRGDLPAQVVCRVSAAAWLPPYECGAPAGPPFVAPAASAWQPPQGQHAPGQHARRRARRRAATGRSAGALWRRSPGRRNAAAAIRGTDGGGAAAPRRSNAGTRPPRAQPPWHRRRRIGWPARVQRCGRRIAGGPLAWRPRWRQGRCAQASPDARCALPAASARALSGRRRCAAARCAVSADQPCPMRSASRHPLPVTFGASAATCAERPTDAPAPPHAALPTPALLSVPAPPTLLFVPAPPASALPPATAASPACWSACGWLRSRSATTHGAIAAIARTSSKQGVAPKQAAASLQTASCLAAPSAAAADSGSDTAALGRWLPRRRCAPSSSPLSCTWSSASHGRALASCDGAACCASSDATVDHTGATCCVIRKRCSAASRGTHRSSRSTDGGSGSESTASASCRSEAGVGAAAASSAAAAAPPRRLPCERARAAGCAKLTTPPSLPQTVESTPPSLPRSARPPPPSLPRSARPAPPSPPQSAHSAPPSMPWTATPAAPCLASEALLRLRLLGAAGCRCLPARGMSRRPCATGSPVAVKAWLPHQPSETGSCLAAKPRLLGLSATAAMPMTGGCAARVAAPVPDACAAAASAAAATAAAAGAAAAAAAVSASPAARCSEVALSSIAPGCARVEIGGSSMCGAGSATAGACVDASATLQLRRTEPQPGQRPSRCIHPQTVTGQQRHNRVLHRLCHQRPDDPLWPPAVHRHFAAAASMATAGCCTQEAAYRGCWMRLWVCRSREGWLETTQPLWSQPLLCCRRRVQYRRIPVSCRLRLPPRRPPPSRWPHAPVPA